MFHMNLLKKVLLHDKITTLKLSVKKKKQAYIFELAFHLINE